MFSLFTLCVCVCASAFSKYIFLRSSFQFLVYSTFLFVSLCSHIVTRTLKSNGNGCKLNGELFRAVMAIGDSVFGAAEFRFPFTLCLPSARCGLFLCHFAFSSGRPFAR